MYHASGWKPIDYPVQQAQNLNHKFLALKKTNQWQLNALNGAVLIPAGFDSIFLVSDLLALKRNGRYTLIKQADIQAFTEGKPVYKLADKVSELNHIHLMLTIGSMTEVIDSKMNPVIKLDRQTVKPASFGFIAERGKAKYIIGWPGLENTRFDAVQVADPWMKVKSDTTEQLYYIPDHSLFTAQADSIWFKDQFTFVRQNDSLNIINTEKKIFKVASTDQIQIISTASKMTHLLIQTKGNLKLYNATTGKLEISGAYQSLLPVSNSFVIFRKKEKYGIQNFNGKIIVPPVYDIAFKIRNSTYQIIENLEPWCSTIAVDGEWNIVNEYLIKEQPKTLFDLSKKIKNTQ